ncbi:MAG: iron-containing redox enzyme family protein [Acidimicrobiales bacterium]
MDNDRMRQMVLDAVGPRGLLRHPFYRRWEAGELGPAELSGYAEQYRHVEAALPDVLETIADGLTDGRPKTLVEENLRDERSVPVAHLFMFDAFAARVGARQGVEAEPATARLVGLQRKAAFHSPADGIANLAAYECQAAEIAISKADGLRCHYGIDGLGTWFWDTHGALEARHADWSIEALCLLDVPSTEVADAVGRSAQAWWEFLDERESAASAA